MRCLLRKTEQKLYKINTSSISIGHLCKQTSTTYMWIIFTPFLQWLQQRWHLGTVIIQFVSDSIGKKKLLSENTKKLVIYPGNSTFTSCVTAFVFSSIFNFAAFTSSVPVQMGNAKPCKKFSPFPLGGVHLFWTCSRVCFHSLANFVKPRSSSRSSTSRLSLVSKTEDRLWSNTVTSKFTLYLCNCLYELPSYF